MKSLRNKFETRRFRLVGRDQLSTVLALLPNLPIDSVRPLEVIVREEVKARKLDQNALMWAGPLKDIAEQGYISGRKYSAEVWHEYFKRELLPEAFDADMTREGYLKWDFDPEGVRILIGSTKDLTVKGFALYLQQVEAFAANIGVQFHVNPNDGFRQ